MSIIKFQEPVGVFLTRADFLFNFLEQFSNHGFTVDNGNSSMCCDRFGQYVQPDVFWGIVDVDILLKNFGILLSP